MNSSRLSDGRYRGCRVSTRLVREGHDDYVPRRVRSSGDVYDFFCSIQLFDREHFYAVHLDTKQQIIACDEVSRGTLDAAPVHPREVYKAAILTSAASIIAVHNHPSGDPNPSADDRAITHRLSRAGKLLGIPLLDHVIIGHERYASLRDLGVL